jgi:hypothetical protein
MSTERPMAERIAAVEEWIKRRDAVPEGTVAGIAREHGLSKREVRTIIDRARYKLAAHAEKYVAAHMESVEQAIVMGIKDGNANALGVAQRGAEWALERIGQGNARVLDVSKATGSVGPQIVIGIAVGGVQVKEPVQEEAIEAESRVMITASAPPPPPILEVVPEPAEPIRLDPPPIPPVREPVRRGAQKGKKSATQKTLEAKAQKLLAAVTYDTGPVVTRSLIELGYDPRFAWEMVKEMLALDETPS